MGEREITARSDVYALGCVTYEMLIGDPPFTGSTAQAIVAKVLTADPAPLTAQRRSVTPQLEAAVLTALEKLPADRFGTPAEFAAALNGALRRPDGAIHPAQGPRAPRRHRRRGAGARGAGVPRRALGQGDTATPRPSPSCSGAFATRRSTTPASRRTERPSSIAPPRRPAPPSCSSSAPTIRRRPPSASPRPTSSPFRRRESWPSWSARNSCATASFWGPWRASRSAEALLGKCSTACGRATGRPDGTELAIIHDVSGRDRLEFPIGKVLYEASGYLSDPRVSPDGRHVAFAEHPFRWDDRGT